MKLEGKVIAVGVTGGIAAYKTCELVSKLTQAGAEVNVIMTANATQFVAPLTFETLSKHRVICDMFDRDYMWEVEHISIAKKSDLFIIAPSTANFVAKMANGIADDFLTTTVMAAKCPTMLAPAMNTAMLNSLAYKKNAEILFSRGVNFVSSKSGLLACGDVGDGRMAEPGVIFDEAVKLLNIKNDYAGKTVLVTCGGTMEAIDPVRYITNHSSGKMGIEIARACVKRGANVILIVGNVSVPIDFKCELISVKSTQDMFDAVMNKLPQADIVIKAAAPADYRVVKLSEQKIKTASLTLELVKNPDIAKAVGENKGDKKLIIFSAETENLESNAKKKLKSKNADMVVANDVTQEGAGFNVDTNIAEIITADKVKKFDKMPKSELAHVILDNILEL